MKSNPEMYEINTVSWLYELSVRYGRTMTIADVPPEEWERFQRSGFDYIWLMGIWKRSKAGIRIFQSEPEYEAFKALFDSVLPGWTEEDLTGSPYSIASYEPDPLVGTWEDVAGVRTELRSRGMRLVLDFVPNHTAPDHPWVFERPDYYIRGTEPDYKQNRSAHLPLHKEGETIYLAHGKDPYSPPWTDTVQLNYFNSGMRSSMIDELKKISLYCDGVRCDMAMLVLNDIFQKTWGGHLDNIPHEIPAGEFWQSVRKEVPDLLLMAESYWDNESRLLSLGFNYVYDKRFYDRARNGNAGQVIAHLKTDNAFQKKLVRFIENHDEERSASAFEKERLRAAAVLLSTLPGMKLYHHGQFEGKKVRLPVQLRRVKDEEPDTELRSFYERLFSKTKLKVFSQGKWELKDVKPEIDDSFRNLIAYTWTRSEEIVLVVVNFSSDHSQGRIPVNGHIAPDADYLIVDELNERVYRRNGKEMIDPGLHVILDGFQSHIFYIPGNFTF